MPLVAAAIVPHSPVLIPAIAGEHAPLLALTRQSLLEVADEFYARQVDTIILLTPHGQVKDSLPTMNIAEQFIGRLVEFGEAQTNLQPRGATHVGQYLKQEAEHLGVHLALQTTEQLDYGSTVPLALMADRGLNASLLPITVGPAQIEQARNVARVIEECAHHRRLRIGLLASADLVRRGEKVSTRPLPLERAIGQAIGQVNPGPLLNEFTQTDVCGLAPIVTLLTCLQPMARQGRVRSFEAPLGVGLMTASIDIAS